MYIPLIVLIVIVWFFWSRESKKREEEQELRNKLYNKEVEAAEKTKELEKLTQDKKAFSEPTSHSEFVSRYSNPNPNTGNFNTDKARNKLNYKDGKLDGVCKYYYETGELSDKSEYKEGKRHGTRKCYHPNGNLQLEANFENDKAVGTIRDYYENGQLKGEAEYIDGKMEGVSKSYYENGALSKKENFKNGKSDGVCQGYYDNGDLFYERQYSDGKEVNIWKSYYKSGKLSCEIDYTNPPKIETKIYYESGVLMSHKFKIYELENNSIIKRHEEDRTDYYESGKVRLVFTYRYNSFMEKRMLDAKCSCSTKAYYESGVLMYEEIYDNFYLVGSVIIQKTRNFEDGKPYERKFLEKDDSGNIAVEENYKNGKLDGVRKVFLGYNVKVKDTTGELISKEIFDSTKLEEEGLFNNGLRDGETKKFDDSGRLIEVSNWKEGKKINEKSFCYCGWDDAEEYGKVLSSEDFHDYVSKDSWGKEYNASGKIIKENKSEGGKYTATNYYESGQIEMIYVSDDKNTLIKIYSEDGKLLSEESQDKQLRRHGLYKHYYKNGNIKSEAYYVHAALHGLTKQYSNDGKLIAEINYEDNEKTFEKIYDKITKEEFDKSIEY